eukprot:Lankesteria_metandrocarpae@DN4734_c0_g1_i5.p1
MIEYLKPSISTFIADRITSILPVLCTGHSAHADRQSLLNADRYVQWPCVDTGTGIGTQLDAMLSQSGNIGSMLLAGDNTEHCCAEQQRRRRNDNVKLVVDMLFDQIVIPVIPRDTYNAKQLDMYDHKDHHLKSISRTGNKEVKPVLEDNNAARNLQESNENENACLLPVVAYRRLQCQKAMSQFESRVCLETYWDMLFDNFIGEVVFGLHFFTSFIIEVSSVIRPLMSIADSPSITHALSIDFIASLNTTLNLCMDSGTYPGTDNSSAERSSHFDRLSTPSMMSQIVRRAASTMTSIPVVADGIQLISKAQYPQRSTCAGCSNILDTCTPKRFSISSTNLRFGQHVSFGKTQSGYRYCAVDGYRSLPFLFRSLEFDMKMETSLASLMFSRESIARHSHIFLLCLEIVQARRSIHQASIGSHRRLLPHRTNTATPPNSNNTFNSINQFALATLYKRLCMLRHTAGIFLNALQLYHESVSAKQTFQLLSILQTASSIREFNELYEQNVQCYTYRMLMLSPVSPLVQTRVVESSGGEVALHGLLRLLANIRNMRLASQQIAVSCKVSSCSAEMPRRVEQLKRSLKDIHAGMLQDTKMLCDTARTLNHSACQLLV